MSKIILVYLILFSFSCRNSEMKREIIYDNIPDQLMSELQKGLDLIDDEYGVFIGIGEVDNNYVYRIIKAKIIPNEMRFWMESSNRFILCKENKIKIFFFDEIELMNSSYDLIGGYRVVIDTEGTVISSELEQ